MWLKKVGSIIGKAGLIAGQVAGVIPQIQRVYQLPAQTGSVVNTVQNDLEQIGAIIVTIEAVGQALNLAGPDKLKAAAPLVAQAILQSSLLVGHKIQDEAKFQQGCAKLADGMVDILNSLDDPTSKG